MIYEFKEMDVNEGRNSTPGPISNKVKPPSSARTQTRDKFTKSTQASSKTVGHTNGFCQFHFKYKRRARKCQQPCKWVDFECGAFNFSS